LTIGQLATAAIMRAADPRYGHACTTRPAHAVSKLYYLGARQTHYCAFSIVPCGGGRADDLFDGLRQPASQPAAA
jgi:hypothetical protein